MVYSLSIVGILVLELWLAQCALSDVPWVISSVAGGGSSTDSSIPATRAFINGPSGIWDGGNGVIYFTETRTHIVRKLDASGIVHTIAGVSGSSGSGNDNDPATSSLLNYPRSVAADSLGQVYIAAFSNYKVKKVTTGGLLVTTAGNGASGNSNGVSATSTAIGQPEGVWVNSVGQLYYSAYYPSRAYLKYLDSNNIIILYAGASSYQYTPGNVATSTAFKDISTLTADTTGRLYFTDGSNHVVNISPTKKMVNLVIGSGTSAYSGESTRATATALSNPNSVALDTATGDVYVSTYDGARVQKLSNSTGLVTTFAGNGLTNTEISEGAVATSGSIGTPSQVLFNTNGLYVTSGWNKVMLVHTPYPSVQPSVAPTVPFSQSPTEGPTEYVPQPTGQPTRQPTSQPTSQPTGDPSAQPTGEPSTQPSAQPTAATSGAVVEPDGSCSGGGTLVEAVISHSNRIQTEKGNVTSTVTRKYRRQF